DGRDGVEHRVRDRRDEVGRARTRGRERDADLARRLRVALSGVAGALLVAAENVADARVVERVVGWEVRASGDAEYGLNALGLHAFHDRVDCPHCALPPFLCFGVDRLDDGNGM